MALYRHFTSQEALNAEYDVGRSVTNFPAIIDFYMRESARVREDLPSDLDVPYGPTRAEHLDIFRAERPAAPILIFFHGGYWRSLSSKEYNLVARGPVSAGVTTLLVNYALCPDVTIEEIVRQARAAVAWAYRNALDFAQYHSVPGFAWNKKSRTTFEGRAAIPSEEETVLVLLRDRFCKRWESITRLGRLVSPPYSNDINFSQPRPT